MTTGQLISPTLAPKRRLPHLDECIEQGHAIIWDVVGIGSKIGLDFGAQLILEMGMPGELHQPERQCIRLNTERRLGNTTTEGRK